jgi:hypothetical protein
MKYWVLIIVRVSSIALIYKISQLLMEQTSIALSIGQTAVLTLERMSG